MGFPTIHQLLPLLLPWDVDNMSTVVLFLLMFSMPWIACRPSPLWLKLQFPVFTLLS